MVSLVVTVGAAVTVNWNYIKTRILELFFDKNLLEKLLLRTNPSTNPRLMKDLCTLCILDA